MTLRVIGAGLGRTGTSSLKAALEQLLGEPCYHMFEVMRRPEHVSLWRSVALGEVTPDWDELFQGYAAAVDWPVASFWSELAQAFPEAVIVLSVRDGQSWWESAASTIFRHGEFLEGDQREMVEALFSARFPVPLDDASACIAAMETHNQSVRDGVPRERLLEWQAADGWAPLCAALDLRVPTDPFPHRNTRQELRSRMGV